MGSEDHAISPTPAVVVGLRAAAAKAVATRRRERLTLVETGDASLALTAVGLVVTAIVVWRRRPG